MTVATTSNKAGPYTGDGSTTTFSYPFRILQSSDLEVTHTDTAGSETVLTEGVDYTVSGAGDAGGGFVTYPISGAALLVTEKLTLRRVVQFTQTLDLTNQGAWLAENHEDAFDKSIMALQQLNEELSRAVILSVSTTGIDPVLPSPQATTLIGWDASAAGLINYTIPGLTSPIPLTELDTAGASTDDIITYNGTDPIWGTVVRFAAEDGSAQNPPYGFQNEANPNGMGMYRAADDELGFSRNGSEGMRLDGTGLGVGTSSIQGKGHFSKGSSGATVHATADELIVEDDGNAGISILTPDSSIGRVIFGTASNNDKTYIQWDDANNALTFHAQANEVLTLRAFAASVFNEGGSSTRDWRMETANFTSAVLLDADGSSENNGMLTVGCPFQASKSVGHPDQAGGRSVTISSGQITVNDEDYRLTVNAESGTADNLDEISGGFPGQIIALAAASGDTITIRVAGVGVNILINNLTNQTMENLKIFYLQRINATSWQLLNTD